MQFLGRSKVPDEFSRKRTMFHRHPIIMHDHEFLLREDGWSKAKTEITKKKKEIFFINI